MDDMLDYFENLARQKSGKSPITAPDVRAFNESPTAALLARDLGSNPFAYAPFTGLTLGHRANQNRYLDELGKTNLQSAVTANNQARMAAGTDVLKMMMQYGMDKAGSTPGVLQQILGGIGIQPTAEDVQNLATSFRSGQMKTLGEGAEKGAQAGIGMKPAVGQLFRDMNLEAPVDVEPPNVTAARFAQGPKETVNVGSGTVTRGISDQRADALINEQRGRQADARDRLQGKNRKPTASAKTTAAPTAYNFLKGVELTDTDADKYAEETLGLLFANAVSPEDKAAIQVIRVPGENAYIIHAPGGRTYTVSPTGRKKNP